MNTKETSSSDSALARLPGLLPELDVLYTDVHAHPELSMQEIGQADWQRSGCTPPVTDGLISLGGPAKGFETCLVSTNGTVLDDGEDITLPRASTAVKPLIALTYHFRYT